MNKLVTTLAILAAVLLPLSACSANNDTPARGDTTQATAASATTSTPPPIAALKQQGLVIEGTFDAPDGLTGYVASVQGRPLAIYVTTDEQYAIIGTLVDAQGNNLSDKPLQRVAASKYQDIWPKLKNSHWVANGASDAKRVIYEFMDPNCPYCHKFWQDSRPWVEAGKVQVREIVVGILTPTSMSKGGTILAAENPSVALMKNARDYSRAEGGGGITPLKNVPAAAQAKVKANNQLMQSLGFFGTPAIIYHDASGEVRVIQGAPREGALTEVMGSPKP